VGADAVLQARQEQQDVHLGGVVVQHLVEQTPLPTGIDGRQHTEGAVVQLVGRQVAGEVSQGPAQVFDLDAGGGFFPPPPRPSSGG